MFCFVRKICLLTGACFVWYCLPRTVTEDTSQHRWLTRWLPVYMYILICVCVCFFYVSLLICALCTNGETKQGWFIRLPVLSCLKCLKRFPKLVTTITPLFPIPPMLILTAISPFARHCLAKSETWFYWFCPFFRLVRSSSTCQCKHCVLGLILDFSYRFVSIVDICDGGDATLLCVCYNQMGFGLRAIFPTPLIAPWQFIPSYDSARFLTGSRC